MSDNKNVMQYLVAAIIVVIVAALLISLRGSSNVSVTTVPSSAATGNMSIALTDPPLVPAGTQSLVITYSGVDLHEMGTANSTGFIDFNASGTVNLMNLTNVSQTIASIRTQANQSFDFVRFDITSAVITISNVTYNVTVPSGGVVARINGTANATSSGAILIDLSPTVMQVYTSSNQSVFVMIPSARAIAIGRSLLNGNIGLHVGEIAMLQGRLAAAVYAQRPNISITSATATESGNVTQLQVTVTNNGNSSVLLSDLALRGFFEAVPNLSASPQPFNININAPPLTSGGASAYGNASLGLSHGALYVNASANATGNFNVGPTMQLNSSLNSTVIASLRNVLGGSASGGAALSIYEAEIFNRNFHNQLNFLVASNGSLELPYESSFAMCPAIIVSAGIEGASMQGCQAGSFGYSLSPGASETLTFNRVITMPNVGVVISPGVGIEAGSSSSDWVGPRVHSAVIVLIPNQTYSVTVHGDHGAYASAKATASGYVTNYASSLVDVTSVQISLNNTSTGKVYNETMAGFISRTNSTVSYSVYSYGGAYAIALPRLPSYGFNVTGFSVNTAGFTLLNYGLAAPPSPCPVCGSGTECPMIACVGGTGSVYLLNIMTPALNYTGPLWVTEHYKLASNASAT